MDSKESSSLELSNTEQISTSASDSKKSGLLKRSKEKPASLGNASDTENSRLQMEKTLQNRACPETTADNKGQKTNKKLPDTASNVPSKQEEKKTKTIKYQDALSLRYGFLKLLSKT